MTPARLTLLLLLILVAAVLVVVVLRRGSAQRDAQRVEAADLRTRADDLASTLTGQAAFADQAAERAEVARAEAERKGREAQRLEAEAAERRAAAQATKRDYETTMRRADDIDPDVKESSFAPVDTDGAADDDARPAADERAPAAGPTGAAEDEAPMTRAERRQARDAEEAGGSAGPSGAVAVGAAAAAGASPWGARDDEAGTDHESERIASAADFRDDVPADADDAPAPDDTGDGRPDRGDASTEPTDDLSHDVQSPRGEWGGPRQDEPAGPRRDEQTDTPHGERAELIVIGEPEAYAAREPIMAADQGAPVTPEPVGTDDEVDDEPSAAVDETSAAADETSAEPTDEHAQKESTDEHAPAEVGAAVAETDDTGRSAADVAEHPAKERHDPTPTRDWAADEGELLEEAHERGERLEAERAELAGEEPGAAAADEVTTEERPGRRVSDFHELRDGGFGVGSAAPLEDGAQPLDHPVQGYRDTMTFRTPGDAGYDSADPDVWFYDEDAAQRNGFRHADD